jgi:integrase
MYLYCAIGIYAGLRDGEIQRLKWKDIYNVEKVMGFEGRQAENLFDIVGDNFDVNTMAKALKNDEKKLVEFLRKLTGNSESVSEFDSKIMVNESKNRRIREVPLATNLRHILQIAYQERMQELIDLEDTPLLAQERILDEYIVQPENTTYNELHYRFDAQNCFDYLLKAIKFQIKRNGEVVKISPHVFRYTFVSLMLQAGEQPDNVRRWVGHSHQTMTDIYGYLKAEGKRIEFK